MGDPTSIWRIWHPLNDPGVISLDALRARDSQGLQADVKHLAWCASQVRNRLSARYWRGVVGLQRQMQEAMATRGSSREVYERVLLSLAALTGFSEEDMMHDEGWRVMRLGRRLERMQFVAGILVRQLESPHATRPEAGTPEKPLGLLRPERALVDG